MLFRKALEDILEAPLEDLHFGLACIRSHTGGLGLQDPRFVHGPAFLGANLTYAAAREEVPAAFWEELSSGWSQVRTKFCLPADLLASMGSPPAGPPPEIAKDWCQQRWWQALIAQHIEKTWVQQAPLRLRVLK